jgi:putative endonuclease
MNTSSIGGVAEELVAKHLSSIGYEIISRNWKRTVCELDIIAIKDNIIYFVEVKYRSQTGQGSGLEYITAKKLKQLEFAAEIWVKENNWDGDYRLMAASVRNKNGEPIIEELLEIV